MALPERYVGPSKEGGPKMILEALKLLGTVEAAGFKDNPRSPRMVRGSRAGEDLQPRLDSMVRAVPCAK
jgi:hypothetical protein